MALSPSQETRSLRSRQALHANWHSHTRLGFEPGTFRFKDHYYIYSVITSLEAVID